jgi:diguanylate cyclase (GGDEF)-like protein
VTGTQDHRAPGAAAAVRPAPVLAFAAAVTVAAVTLTALIGSGPRVHLAGASPVVVALVLAACFAASEAAPVHLELRRETVSFSLSLIPLVVGLYALNPWALVAARVIGSALTLVCHRRQRLVKLAVNLSGFWLETVVAAAMFRGLNSADGAAASSWPAVFAATATGALAFAIHLSAAICVYHRRWESSLWSSGAAIIGGALVETSVGVIAVTLLVGEPAALIPLAVTIALVMTSYRAHASLVAKHRDLEQLYGITGVMADALRAGEVLPALLSQAAELLHAESAWVVLADDDGAVLEAILTEDGSAVAKPAGDAARELHRVGLSAQGAALLAPGGADFPELGAGEVLVAPLRGPSGPLGALAVGDRSGELRRFAGPDLRRLAALAGQASVAIDNSRLIERLRRQAVDSEYQSLHDPLTGLPNRALFTRELGEALQPGALLGVLLLDLDRFKEVNDTLGHHNGDLLLEQVGSRLREALRTGDVVARLGGDEFAVLVPDIRGEQAAVQVARGIAELLERPFAIGDISVDVGASVGIAIAPAHGEDPGTLLRRADVAMYTAKSGQTTVEVYRADHDGYSAERLSLVSDLRHALHHGGLAVHYQPQIDLTDGNVYGAEALVRWDHPTRGRLQPDEFIAIAEHTGLVRRLTHVVLDDALAECRRWWDRGHRVRVSVNVSARALVEPTLPDDVAASLARHHLPATALCVEVTESSIMADPKRAIEVLERIQATGVTIAVDDFGTGYSSLAYLKGLPVRELKIDKSFVLTMRDQATDSAIVQTIVDLARNLDLAVCAEGVEDAEVAELLRQKGCDLAQGYHYARPLPADAFLAWIDAHAVPASDPVVVPFGTRHAVGTSRST